MDRSITLPDDLHAYAEAQAASEGLASADALVEQRIRAERNEAELLKLLDAADSSGVDPRTHHQIIADITSQL